MNRYSVSSLASGEGENGVKVYALYPGDFVGFCLILKTNPRGFPGNQPQSQWRAHLKTYLAYLAYNIEQQNWLWWSKICSQHTYWGGLGFGQCKTQSAAVCSQSCSLTHWPTRSNHDWARSLKCQLLRPFKTTLYKTLHSIWRMGHESPKTGRVTFKSTCAIYKES